MVQLFWLVMGIVIVVSALRLRTHRDALAVGRGAVAALYLVGGALVNGYYLARGDDYAQFADASYIPFVTDTWRSLVVPDHDFFISLLIVFEVVVGVLVALGGRRAVAGFLAAIGFHVALLSFGWGFYLWSVPMTIALVLLLRAQLTAVAARRAPTPSAADRRPAAPVG